MQISGKTALVSGGSAGIGLEIARQLADLGATVVIIARDSARAQAAVASHARPIAVIAADLAQAADQDRVIAEIGRAWPDLSILVNNAGTQVNLPTHGVGDDGRMDDLRAEIDLNLAAPVALSLGLMPLLARQPESAIVNIASGLAIAPKRSAPVYCATKAGLRTFSRALRYRCEDAAPTIRVIDVVMALVDTAMTSGRGRGKISAAAAAQAVIDGIANDHREVWVGKTRLLRLISGLAPPLAYRLLRNG